MSNEFFGMRLKFTAEMKQEINRALNFKQPSMFGYCENAIEAGFDYQFEKKYYASI